MTLNEYILFIHGPIRRASENNDKEEYLRLIILLKDTIEKVIKELSENENAHNNNKS